MKRKRNRAGHGFRWYAALVTGLVVAALAGCTGADKPPPSESDGPPDVGELEAVAIPHNEDGEVVAGDEGGSIISPGDSSGSVGFSRVRLPPHADLDATEIYLK